MKKKKILFALLLAGVMAAFLDAPFREHPLHEEVSDTCAVYLLLNIDGMKGLGHTAFMLRDEQGNGYVYSYNGMQYSLIECLLGKAGIGKMKVFALKPDEATAFLQTGELQVEDTAECDNFDRVLYRRISREEYEHIQNGATRYIDAGVEFESLYAAVIEAVNEDKIAAEESLNEFLKREDVPKYQIYVHNCDSVARELIGLIDAEMSLYNEEHVKLTPTGNYLGMCKEFGGQWGYEAIGKDTLIERIFWR